MSGGSYLLGGVKTKTCSEYGLVEPVEVLTYLGGFYGEVVRTSKGRQTDLAA